MKQIKALIFAIRSFALIVGAAALIISGASCSGKKQDADSNGKITLQVLNYFDTTSANTQDTVTQVWEAFEKANPDIQIIREDAMSEQYHNKVEAYVAAGRLPDVLYAWPKGRSTSLQQNHLLKDLLPFVERDGLVNDFIPQSFDPKEYGAGYVAEIPRNVNITHIFLVNTEVLEACGLSPAKTYSELKAQVPVLRANGYDTVVMPNEDAWTMQSTLFSMVAGRFCGADWADRILNGEMKFTDPDFVSALNFIKTIFDDNVIPVSSLGTAYGTAPGLFGNKRGAYYIDGAWRIGTFVTDKSTGQGLFTPEQQKKILVTVFPDIEGAKLNKSTSVQLGSGYCMSAAIPAGSAKEEAAWRLINWLSGKEVITHEMEIGLFANPTRTDIDLNTLQVDPLQQTAGNLRNQYTTATPVIDDAFQSEVFSAVNTGLQEIAAKTRTPQQVAQSVQAAFESWSASR